MERRGPARAARMAAAWWQRTRPGRAVARFGAARGAVLTGGIAYSALFSVFAALTIGYAAFTAVLQSHQSLRRDVLDTLATWLPGVLAVGGRGLIAPSDLAMSVPLSVTGLVAVVVLVFSATGAMAALRTAVRAMFDERTAATMVAGKLRDLAGLAGMAAAVFVSAVLGAAVTAVVAALPLPDVSGVVRLAGIAVAFAVDAGTFALVVVVLAGVHPPGRDLARGALLAATGIGVLRVLGAGVVAGAAANPLYASFAAVVTLLIWVNLITRVVLLAAAWTADPHATGPRAHPGSTGP